ncbi:NAD(P)/FAD-dependent oxidoreductase [Candidatus Woesearchaeota archaeon]|nr:MAG: NAD(P)/FAD-dependent oxidoreductase [Candidatus Woesearchaeota archaeon]
MAMNLENVNEKKASGEYDIIVIGAGSGGLNIAGFMNRAGFRTLLIDRSDENIGGDCLNFGCVPSKALLHVARLCKAAREAKRYGLSVSGNASLAKAMAHVKASQDTIRQHENAEYFRRLGMDVVLGSARFAGKRSVVVGGRVFRGRKIVLATGSRPRMLSVPGLETVPHFTNETIFGLKRLPRRFLVVGGGPIGVELGQAFALLGSEVTILERGEQFLPKERGDLTALLRKQLEKDGVRVLFNASVERFVPKRGVFEALVRIGGQQKKSATLHVPFDAVLVSIGRELNITGLDLQKAGIALDPSGRKLVVDEYLRTTNKDVFVCGDVAGGYLFTHAAELHARVILSNIFKPRLLWSKLSYDHFAWVTYTSPEIATFGLSEDALKKRGVSFKTLAMDFSDDDRSITDEATEGKLVIFLGTRGRKKGRILGGSIVAQNAGELAQELILAMTTRTPVKALFGKTYPYPTASRVNRQVIAKDFAGKLTPFVKRVLHLLYR